VREERPDVDEVRRLARLARIETTDDQARRLTRDLAAILEFVADLPASDQESVPGAPDERHSPMAADRPEPGLVQERALAPAPRRKDGLFLVPRVIAK
jgi:aspartyl-tRNA(Asn)/glutamyl-tRNA(Gln) amidotransferase subunit C